MDARWFQFVRLPRRQVMLLAVAALPFVASLGFRCVERSPRPLTLSGDRPALTFDQYFVNLSEVHNTARVEALFHFKNSGKSPAVIKSLEPSCGCLNPKLEKRAYMPGEECDFVMSVLTTRENAGPHDYELKINYEDPQPRSVTVAFKVVVRREVTIHPSQLQFWQSGKQETKRTIVISDMRPTPFHVTGVTCNSPLVKFKIGTPVEDPDAGRETTISITVAAQVPQKGVHSTLMIKTDDPRYPQIPIPIWISDMHASSIQQTSGTSVRPISAQPKP